MQAPAKLCQICGDVAIGFNYSILSCLNCKVFFYRNHQKSQTLTCRQQSACPITPTNRSCTKCRIDRCFQMGMSRFSARTGSLSTNNATNFNNHNLQSKHGFDRLIETHIYKEIKRTEEEVESPNQNESITSASTLVTPNSQLNAYERFLIKEIEHALEVFPDENSAPAVTSATSMTTFFDIPELYFKCFFAFCMRIAAFDAIRPEDQLLIVKPYCFDMLLSRFIFLFDQKKNGYRMVESMACTEATFINLDLFKELKNQERIEEYINFYKVYQAEMNNDLTLFGLLSAQLMFEPRDGVSCTEYLRYNHHKYTRLFLKYLLLKYGPSGGQAKYDSLRHLTGQLKRMKETEILMFQEMDLLKVPHIMIEVYSMGDLQRK